MTPIIRPFLQGFRNGWRLWWGLLLHPRRIFADFMHDTFPHRRSWSLHEGWVFRFGRLRLKIKS